MREIEMKIRLTLDKVTKRTHRYAETSNDIAQESVMPTVYIKTKALLAEFGAHVPENIVVTVEEVK